MVINEIELKRKALIKTALQYGLNSNKTIECSQELDILLLQEIKWCKDITKEKQVTN
ncbi:aspartyl-phosphate phosphatase Spo0E family protein [Metabacillus bambusae]|uniref:Aspartyl-phosphate phosphatase Spo0E family protein n=1 Tax=Metabacillus bambusae TaxID=2795218 RepID=A0ABS3N0A2_9BACI|nr:aspartyl-phosphate phosphatase Spo0E family protein [Metabacillus bambusae]MBO1511680.1 aspartyl-phosphate phosphatase Spo0E family protein [Metabacillus bambusae]